jgi:hypothetical protein
MVHGKQTGQAHPMVQGFSGAKSALEEVFQYYKVQRHGEGSLEKPYFLLSRCAHVLFSAWLAEQDSPRSFFWGVSPPAAFTIGPDFGELRYSEYRRRMLHGEGLDEHLTNETKWLEFWMRLLQQFDAANARVHEEFGRRLLAWVGEPGFLEGKAAGRNKEEVRMFLTGCETGRVLVQTMHVLEDFAQVVVGAFAAAEARMCVLEPVVLLVGLLREMRRIIIWETPAQGPYTWSRTARWRTPSRLGWLFGRKIPGVLRVVPNRMGGEIVCSFHRAAEAKSRPASWERHMRSLEGSYEAELFATWSYDGGVPQEHAGPGPDCKACWTVQNAEAGRLEVLSKQVDSLLDVLQRNPGCRQFVAAVRRVARNDAPQWEATVLPWVHIRQLDQLLDQLTFVCREAQAVGQADAAESAIGRLWPSSHATPAGTARGNGQDRGPDKPSQAVVSGEGAAASGQGKATLSPPVLYAPNQRPPARGPRTSAVPGTLAALLQRVKNTCTGAEENAKSQPSEFHLLPTEGDQAKDAGPENQRTVPEARALDQAPPRDALTSGVSILPESQQRPKPRSSAAQGQGTKEQQEPTDLPSSLPTKHEAPEAEPQPRAAVDPKPPDSAATPVQADSETPAIPARRKSPRPRRTAARRTARTVPPDGAQDALLQRLLEHHGRRKGTNSDQPVSAAELQHDLGWSPSKVRRALTNIFGPQPARVYRDKCEKGTISAFLKAQAAAREPVESRAGHIRKTTRSHVKTPKAGGV